MTPSKYVTPSKYGRKRFGGIRNIMKLLYVAPCFLFVFVFPLGGCAVHGHDKKADALMHVIEEQNRAANVSRKIVLREIFIKNKTLSVAIDVVNEKLEDEKTRMRLRLNLENLASRQSAV